MDHLLSLRLLKPFFDNVLLEHGGLPHVLPLAVHLDFMWWTICLDTFLVLSLDGFRLCWFCPLMVSDLAGFVLYPFQSLLVLSFISFRACWFWPSSVSDFASFVFSGSVVLCSWTLLVLFLSGPDFADFVCYKFQTMPVLSFISSKSIRFESSLFQVCWIKECQFGLSLFLKWWFRECWFGLSRP